MESLSSSLSPFLRERCNIISTSSTTTTPSYILYICTNTLRTNDNPSLDVAIQLSNANNLPLLVHAFFDDKSIHATARRAVFILDAIRELEKSYLTKAIPFTFQLTGINNTSRQPAYLTLASRATIVVTDEPFCEPYLSITDKIKKCTKSNTMITVDSALEVPARLISKSKCSRAYNYRSVALKQFHQRCTSSYPTLTATVSSQSSLELEQFNLPNHLFIKLSEHPSSHELIKGCTFLDHSILPVDHTLGGMAAGKARWRSFLRYGYKTYNKTRNDPLKHHKNGVSRISPYLNLGMLSPFQVARDCCKIKGPASLKYLDEFCTWRGIAYTWCYHHPNHRRSAKDAIPNWAYQTLTKHANDNRKVISLETLCVGQTGQRLWDICQQGLNATGELHNNLRMTWGKEVLKWTRGPEESYKTLLHLNDRYALDALSPPSIAGILWCLGWGDSAKQESNMYGTVRSRSAASISKRYDLVALDKEWRKLRDGSIGGGGLISAFRKSRSGSSSSSSGSSDGIVRAVATPVSVGKKRKVQDGDSERQGKSSKVNKGSIQHFFNVETK
jgi:deoxyribodipyrimidine photolyase